MVYLEAPRALIPGDRLIGDGAGGLRPCPGTVAALGLPGPPGEAALRAALAPLLELAVESVLVSHGEPVLRDGRRRCGPRWSQRRRLPSERWIDVPEMP